MRNEEFKQTESADETIRSDTSMSNNEVDFYKIMRGEEKRTTIMIRNIPNKFKQKQLLEMINMNH